MTDLELLREALEALEDISRNSSWLVASRVNGTINKLEERLLTS